MIIKDFWKHLAQTQNNTIRLLHIFIAFLIVSQIINSNFMSIDYPSHKLNFGAWYHIISGILITILFTILLSTIFQKRGFKHFYSYIYGDFEQIKIDLKSLIIFKLPKANTKGLAVSVQGLGLGALAIVIISAYCWLIAWLTQSTLAPDLQSFHKSITILIEIYIIAHGCMGVLHFLIDRYFSNYIQK
jgi:hypothetical protein